MQGFKWDLDYLGRNYAVRGGNRLIFCLNQVCVRRMWTLWLSTPKQPLLRKDFLVELLDIFGLSFPLWCVGGDFNVIRRSSENWEALI